MKILIRFYDEWGSSTQTYIQVSSQSKVMDVKVAVYQKLKIEIAHIGLYANNVPLDDNAYISDYQFEYLDLRRMNSDFSQSFTSFQCQIEAIQEKNSIQTELSFDFNSKQSLLIQLYEAIRKEQLANVKLITDSLLINDTEYCPWSPMHLSAFIGNEAIFLYLLSQGGNINALSADNWTCMCLAIWQRRIPIIQLMLSQVDINQPCKYGTPLELAGSVDDLEIVQLLLKHPNLSTEYSEKLGPGTLHILQLSQQQQITMQLEASFLKSLSTNVWNHFSQSFMINRPNRPPLIQGVVHKMNFLKLRMYPRYLLLDPDNGVLVRYKRKEDAPLNPIQVIAIESITDIRLSKNEWFQVQDMYYIEIRYGNRHLYLVLQYKAAARKWFESIKNCIGYVKYVNCKINDTQNIVQIMMEKSNQQIIINDVNSIDQQHHIKKQQIEKKLKYQQSLDSVIEISHNESNIQKELGIKDFQILEHIGRGAFGNVFKASYNNKIYALKQQDKAKLIEKQELKYVIGELEILKQLHHPFIIRLHYAFQTPFYLYLALDYCQQGDLSKYMTRGMILEEFTAKFIISQVILALEYLHEKAIIYRDLKPENITLDNEGYIKLIDFGLSKEGEERDFIATSFCGSPAYLSPELVAGHGTSFATDIYSIGTLLFEMLTGYPPFYCNNLKELLHNIRYTKLICPKTVSPIATNLLTRLLQKDPEERIGFNDINVLKKHIFFAEIDWVKLKQKKYKPPKLIRREGGPRGNPFIIKEHIDVDYKNEAEKKNYIPEWSY